MRIKSLILLALILCLLSNESTAKNRHDDILIPINDSVSISLVRVDGGTFFLGNTIIGDSLSQDDERPVKEIKLKSYCISKYEITKEQWYAVMGGRCPDASNELPKGNLSYTDCMAFVDSLSNKIGKYFRLPTEVEWEFAAKGGINDTLFIYSGSNKIDDVAWYNDSISHPVGKKHPNKLGLYDMSGNVFEWCFDNYQSYDSTQNDIDSSRYVIRGGGYNRSPEFCRVTRRNGINKNAKKPEYGFRIVLCINKEDTKSISTPLQSSQNKKENTKDIILIILTVIVVGLAVALWLHRRKGADKMILLPNAGSTSPKANNIEEASKIVEPENPTSTPAPISPSGGKETPFYTQDKFSIDQDNFLVIGASVRGKGHIQTNLPCQDNHKYTYLNNGWGIAVVSDGAGSASKSQIGSKIVVERASIHFKEVIKEFKWIEQKCMPSSEEWSQVAYSVLRRVYNDIKDFAGQKNIVVKELSATVIVLIHSPYGILSTHIGDGRAGYRNGKGEWLPIIIPHKGDEANQTIFITSQFWDNPSFRMSSQLIPESVVIREPVTGFTLMSDGCENTSWQVSQIDENTGKVCDPNRPFQKFYDPIANTLVKFHNDNVSANERAEAWYSFLDTGKEFFREVDDKTLILGIIL